MWAANSDVFAPGDAQGVRTTSGFHHVPQGTYEVKPANVAVGMAGLLVLAWLAHHHLGRRRR